MNALSGQREIRTNEQARARIPMNAAQVRDIIDEMMSVRGSMKSRLDRISRMAVHAIRIGNVSEDGKAVWREWLNQNPG